MLGRAVGIKANIATVRIRRRAIACRSTTALPRDASAYQYNPWMVQWTSLAPLTRGELAGEIGKWYASKGQEGMAPHWRRSQLAPACRPRTSSLQTPAALLHETVGRLWLEGLGYSNLDPKPN